MLAPSRAGARRLDHCDVRIRPEIGSGVTAGASSLRYMSTHVVIARIAGLAGRTPELRQLLLDRAITARGEPGCAGYEVAELVGEPATFLVVETWRSRDEMRAHFVADAHADYQHRVDELLARPSEVLVHDVAATTRPAPSTSPTDAGRFG